MKRIIRTNFALFKAETKKVWSRPILELAVILIALISISAIQTLVQIINHDQAQATIQSLIIKGVSSMVSLQMLPLIIICSILMSLSFARDYEQGLMQSLLSSPVSRKSLFALKFLSVIIPLTFISWGFIVFFSILNFYSNATLVFQFAILALPVAFLSLLFYGGIATLVSLVFKRTIASALTAMLTGFFFWFITTLNSDSIGSVANYLVVTPYKAPLVLLDRALGISYPMGTLENSLPLWVFGALTLLYACIFVFPTYIYFTRRFEVRE